MWKKQSLDHPAAPSTVPFQLELSEVLMKTSKNKTKRSEAINRNVQQELNLEPYSQL